MIHEITEFRLQAGSVYLCPTTCVLLTYVELIKTKETFKKQLQYPVKNFWKTTEELHHLGNKKRPLNSSLKHIHELFILKVVNIITISSFSLNSSLLLSIFKKCLTPAVCENGLQSSSAENILPS